MKKEILVYAELDEGKITRVAKEVLGVGREIADSLSCSLSALVAGNRETSEELIQYGADKVYEVEESSYSPETHTDIMAEICRKASPEVVLLSNTAVGHDIAGRLAYRLKCFPCTDCIKISVDSSGALIQERLVYGGNAIEVVTIPDSKPQLVIIKPGTANVPSPNKSRKGEIQIIKIELDPAKKRAELTGTLKQETEEIKLEDADTIVAGGGGIGGAEGFKQLQKMATVLGGVIGATRPPCDEGWIPVKYEIGLTAKIVKPKLYFAIGISGAAQHLSGCADSKYIVAINTDPDANIFKVSNFGIVADYNVIVPELIDKLIKAKA